MYSETVSEVIGEEERERLILLHLPQVRLIARRIQERLPENIILEDLVSTGVLGLISAIDNFDPRFNVKLKTYAEYKIRGAILDSLRGLDWAPRQKRRKAKQIETAVSQAEQRLKRSPTEEEIALELGVTLDEYHEWLVETRGLNIASLEYASGESSGDLLRYIADGRDNSPASLLERSELERLLATAIEARSSRSVRTWKSSSAPRRSRCRYPSSSRHSRSSLPYRPITLDSSRSSSASTSSMTRAAAVT